MTKFINSHQVNLTGPIEGAFNVEPSDSKDLQVTTRAIMVGTTGDVQITLLRGDTVTVSLTAGILYPFRVQRVFETNTTAENIVGLY